MHKKLNFVRSITFLILVSGLLFSACNRPGSAAGQDADEAANTEGQASEPSPETAQDPAREEAVADLTVQLDEEARRAQEAEERGEETMMTFILPSGEAIEDFSDGFAADLLRTLTANEAGKSFKLNHTAFVSEADISGEGAIQLFSLAKIMEAFPDRKFHINLGVKEGDESFLLRKEAIRNILMEHGVTEFPEDIFMENTEEEVGKDEVWVTVE